MKRYFQGTLFILFVLFPFVYSPYVYAHFPKSDGDMTVTLHVDPNDDPIPGKNAQLYFLFDDATKKFDLATCTCLVSIRKQGKEIYNRLLIEKSEKEPSIWGTSMSYIFPKQDVYQIILKGNSRVKDAFQPFTISWYFRVDPGESGIVTERPSEIPVLLGALFVGITFLVLFGWFIKREILDTEAVDNTKKNR